MKDVRRWARNAAGAALVVSALAAGAQARKIHEYRLHEQEDRGAPFGMTVGPDQTVYTLLPRRDGNWVLSRVKSWWQEKPDEVGVLVEGFSARDAVSGFRQMDVAVTPDGKYVTTILAAGLRAAPDDPYPTDMLVQVFAPDRLDRVASEHMRGLGIRGDLEGGMDRSGQLLVNAAMAGTDADGKTSPYMTWFAVSIPQLKAKLECSYQAAADAKDVEAMEAACGDFAKAEGYASAQELQRAVWGSDNPAPAGAAPPGIAIAPKDRFQVRQVTAEGTALTLVVVNGVTLQAYATQ
jgi:hypothetical protein